jgi:Lon protease-like protein
MFTTRGALRKFPRRVLSFRQAMPPEPIHLPPEIPLFPLPSVVHLPGTILPIHIFEPRYVEMVEFARKTDGIIGMVYLGGAGEDPAWTPGEGGPPARLSRIGCAGRIEDLVELPEGRFNLKLRGIARFFIEDLHRDKPYLMGRIRALEDRNGDARGEAANSALRRLLSLLDRLAKDRGDGAFTVSDLPAGVAFSAAVHHLALLARMDPEDLQGLLELTDVYARARRVEGILLKRIRAQERVEIWRGLVPKDPSVN